MSGGTTTTPPADADAELMARVRGDEPGAFAELVGRFWPRVFGRFRRQLGDRQEAEDLTQNVFMRLYRRRGSYRPSARFTTWLFHIARNVARNAARTRRRRPLVPLGHLCPWRLENEGRHRPLAGRTEPPFARAERAETTRAVLAAVGELGERQRLALELQFRDLSHLEIAAELRLSPQAAKSLLYRARLQLRESLEKVARCG